MKFETRRERERRLKRQKRSGILGIAAAFLLVALLGIALWNGKVSLQKKNAEYEQQKQELQKQIDEQKQRADNLEEYKKYIQTKQFVEEVAKNKFGLIYPDEIVFKPDNKNK